MEKQIISVPDAVGLARPRTRRDFFKVLAAAGAGAAVGSSVLSSRASAQAFSSDAEIGNFALTLEYLEAEFYARALDAGVLSGAALGVFENLASHEAQHVDAIIAYLEGEGVTPVAKPQFTFPAGTFGSQGALIELASVFEPTGVGAYLGAAPAIQDPALLAAALSIYGVEADHVVAIKNLQGIVPPANVTFEKPLTKAEVLAAVAPFLGMGAMMDTGGASPSDWYRAAHV